VPNATHVRLAQVGRRLIARHGRNIDLVTTINTGSKYDPDQSTDVTTAKGVQTKIAAKHIDGNNIQSNDRMYLFDADTVIKNGMTIRDDGDLKVIKVEQIKPGETVVLYKVQVRSYG